MPLIAYAYATYRIRELCYPVTVFGVSDINRKFFPIAFMKTSHETEIDYTNFFKAMVNITKELKLNFEPKYMKIDASKALAKAIKNVFQSCRICMCYFHLKYNVSVILKICTVYAVIKAHLSET
jgi:hypothetical protein